MLVKEVFLQLFHAVSEVYLKFLYIHFYSLTVFCVFPASRVSMHPSTFLEGRAHKLIQFCFAGLAEMFVLAQAKGSRIA